MGFQQKKNGKKKYDIVLRNLLNNKPDMTRCVPVYSTSMESFEDFNKWVKEKLGFTLKKINKSNKSETPKAEAEPKKEEDLLMDVA